MYIMLSAFPLALPQLIWYVYMYAHPLACSEARECALQCGGALNLLHSITEFSCFLYMYTRTCTCTCMLSASTCLASIDLIIAQYVHMLALKLESACALRCGGALNLLYSTHSITEFSCFYTCTHAPMYICWGPLFALIALVWCVYMYAHTFLL